MTSAAQNGHTNGNGRSPSSPTTDENAQLRSRVDASEQNGSLGRRAWQAILNPFSTTALNRLPRVRRPERYLRADDIPVTDTNEDGERPTVRDYHAINLPPKVHVPKKIKTSVKVEGKVWFANERSG